MKNKNLIWAGVVVVIGIIIIIMSQPAQQPVTQLPPVPTTNTDQSIVLPQPPKPTTAAVATIKNALEVKNQKPGTKMTVAVANLEKAGFVAIRNVAHDGPKEIPGSVIASSPLLTRGAHKGVIINVALSPTGIYYASLYADTDGNKVLNTASDQPLKDASGNPFSVRFEANLPVAAGQSYTITMKGGVFSPSSVIVPKGSPVIFTNNDVVSHAIYGSAFGTEHVLKLGGSYVIDTNKLAEGTYSYRDNYNVAMTGTITIID